MVYNRDMVSLRKTTKTEVLVNLFTEIGSSMKMKDVLEITGISGYNSLKALCSYIRKAKSVPTESRIDIRIQGDLCIRVS